MKPTLELLEGRLLLSTTTITTTEQSGYVETLDGDGNTIANWFDMTDVDTIVSSSTDNSYTDTDVVTFVDTFEEVYTDSVGGGTVTAIGQSVTVSTSVATVASNGSFSMAYNLPVAPTTSPVPAPIGSPGYGWEPPHVTPKLPKPVAPVMPNGPRPSPTWVGPMNPYTPTSPNPAPPDGSGDPPTGTPSIPSGPGLPALQSFYVDLLIVELDSSVEDYEIDGTYDTENS